MNGISSSLLGQFIQQGCDLEYSPTRTTVKAGVRGIIVEKIINEILKYGAWSDFPCNLSSLSKNDVNISKYIDRILAQFYRSVQRLTPNERRNLKNYLFNTIFWSFSKIKIFLLNQNCFFSTIKYDLNTQHTIQGKIAGNRVVARIDNWQQVGLQVILGEIKDRNWSYPFPNPGDLVQTLIGAQLASQQGLIVRYNWILYVPASNYHYFSLYPNAIDLLTETLIRYQNDLTPNSCDWCRSLYNKCPRKLIMGGGLSD